MKIKALRLSVAAPAAALALASVGLLASPANAAYVCGAGQVCLYQNAGYTGSVYVVPKIQLSNGLWTACQKSLVGKKFNNGDALDNNVSSVVNKSGSVLFMWETAPTGGAMYGVSGGESVSSLGSFDNKASSAC